MNKNYKTYLIFLGFTSFLWLALQFSKEYNQELEFKLHYTNNDINKVVLDDSDKEVTLQLEGSGLQLLKFSFLEKTIDIDAKEATALSNTRLFLTGKKLKKVLEEAINYKGKISSISKDSLFISYDLLAEREVDIKVKSNLKFQPGYQSLKGVQLENSKVKIIGPTKMLEQISSITTESLVLSSLSNSQEGKLNLDLNDLPEGVSTEFDQVTYSLEVEKLTEGTFKIPIVLKNSNKELLIQIFPKEVDVIFKVALKEFSKIKATDFKVEANFDERGDKSLLPLKLTVHPRQVFDVKLEQTEVQFIHIK